MKTNLLLIFVVLLLSSTTIRAQQASPGLVLEKGVAPHAGLDDIYRRFSEGYKKLDAASVVNLYSDTAAYLAPGSDIQIGRQKVSGIFTGFFESVKKRNGRLEISFRIVQRHVDKNFAYDVGIYTLTSFNEKGESSKDSGKFVAVAKREKKDNWRFQVDGYSFLPKEGLPSVNANPNGSVSNNAAQNASAQSQGGTQSSLPVEFEQFRRVRKEFEEIFAKQVADYLAQFAAVKRGEKLKPECAPDFVMKRPNGTTITCDQITAERQVRFERIKKINYLKIEVGNIELSGDRAVVFTTQRFSRVVPGTDGRDYTVVTDGTVHKEFWTKAENGWKSQGFEEFKQGTVTNTPVTDQPGNP